MIRSRFKFIVRSALMLVLVAVPLFADAQSSGYDWLQWNGDSQHAGNNTAEKKLGPNNVQRLRQLYRVTLPAVVDGAPIYVRNVKISKGAKDMLFMTSKSGDLFAVDAKNGTLIWTQHHNADSCFVDKGVLDNIPKKLACWTTSIPAVDPARAYVYSYGLDGYIHKHHVEDGSEISIDGWPVLVTRKPWVDKVSSALTIATGKNGVSYLYVTSSGYPMPDPGDWGDYQGHLVAINLTDGTSKVFNAMCSNISELLVEKPNSPSCPEVKAGIWARGGVTYSSDTDRIYVSTGNGAFDPANHYWGESVLALNPDGSGVNGGPVDSYTPANFQDLTDTDADLAAYLPLILPVPKGSKYQHLMLQGGKDGKLRLLDFTDLSGTHEPGHTGGELAPLVSIPFVVEITNSPALWVNPADNSTWIFTPTYFGTAGWQLMFDKSGNPSLTLIWKNTHSCATPLVANNVIYCAAFKNLWAFKPTTGQQLWGVYPIGDIHWQSPVVVNGILYITDQSANLIAYAPR
ncbi:MAG: hypothetical protein ACYDBJ_25565 [Aggregatilineales bacterium]